MTHHETIIDHAITEIHDIQPDSICGYDLHHRMFNEDYFIIGYYHAENWINELGGAFQVIAEVQNYEVLNFGECSTDLTNSEAVANMYAYILGEYLLNDLESLRNKWDLLLTESDLKEIEEELKALF